MNTDNVPHNDDIKKSLYTSYIDGLEVWRRYSDNKCLSSEYMKELITNVKYITNDNCIENRHNYEYINKSFKENHENITCICSNNNCKTLHYMFQIKKLIQ